MTITTTTLDTADSNLVLGETLRPLLTHAMGSAVEVFWDTSGPAEAGPPMPHRHLWEEIYAALSQLRSRSMAQRGSSVPEVLPTCCPTPSTSYRNVTDVHFGTITTQGDAAAFFSEVASEVEMNPAGHRRGGPGRGQP